MPKLRLCLQAGSLAALLLLAALASATTAFAHASLLSTLPRDGDVLKGAPEKVSLTFNEAVSPLVFRLIRPDGERIELAAETRGSSVEAALPEGLADGSYALSYRVVSEDGHPVGGTIVFSIGAPSTVAPNVPGSPSLLVRVALWLGRLGIYGGLFVGVGGAVFLAWLLNAPPPKPLHRLLALTLSIGLAATVVSVGLQGLDALALTLTSIVRPGAWITGFRTSFGLTAALAFAAMVLALASLRTSVRNARLLSGVALVGVGAALAASGHASAASPELLTRPAVFVHGIGIAFWVGSLAPLAVLLRRRDGSARLALLCFARAIPYFLAPMVFAGICLAVIQIREPQELLSTAYGRIFLAKCAVLLLLFAFATVNRFTLTPAVKARAPGAAAVLARSVRIELVLTLTIFCLAAGWRFTPPPRSLLLAAAAPVSVHIHTAKAMAIVEIEPGRAGPIEVTLELMAGDFTPIAPKEVVVSFSNAEAGIEPIRRMATAVDDLHWRTDVPLPPVPGTWRVKVELLIGDFEQITLEGEVRLGG